MELKHILGNQCFTFTVKWLEKQQSLICSPVHRFIFDCNHFIFLTYLCSIPFIQHTHTGVFSYSGGLDLCSGWSRAELRWGVTFFTAILSFQRRKMTLNGSELSLSMMHVPLSTLGGQCAEHQHPLKWMLLIAPVFLLHATHKLWGGSGYVMSSHWKSDKITCIANVFFNCCLFTDASVWPSRSFEIKLMVWYTMKMTLFFIVGCWGWIEGSLSLKHHMCP